MSTVDNRDHAGPSLHDLRANGLAAFSLAAALLSGCSSTGTSPANSPQSAPDNSSPSKDTIRPIMGDIEQYLLQAREYIKHKDFEAAISAYEKAVSISDTNYEALSGLGFALTSTGDFKRAVSVYRKLVAAYPEDTQALGYLGYALLQSGEIENAIKTYQKITELTPDKPEAWLKLARAYSWAGQSQEVIFPASKALDLKPDFKEARLLLAEEYRKMGKLPDAIREYNELLSAADNNNNKQEVASIAFTIGKLYVEENDSRSAVNYFLKALEASPDSPRIVREIAVSYDRSGDKRMAVKYYQKLIELQPGKPTFYYRLGELYNQLGQTSLAREVAVKGLNIDKGCGARGLCVVGNSYEKEERYEEAREQFLKAASCRDDETFSEYARKKAAKQDALIERERLIRQQGR
ncbi:MAG: tetratricopeptide repeat protein [Candidatus Dadabacteria bacterium]|nr:MAG: tetratricopeptide repeat protein [Candidatus Dadabacteria bacterium]